MKKILLASTAIVAMASVSSTASAADKISLGLSGFMKHYVGIANHDEAAGAAVQSMALGQHSNTEIHFKGSTTLDNGLSVAVTVEREGDRNNGNTDKSFVTVSSDAMGAISLGGVGHAADDFAVGAPMVGPLDFGDSADWANVNPLASQMNNAAAVRVTGNNNLKMKYVSPTFSGFTVGISYDVAHDDNGSKRALDRATSDDSSSIAAMYEGEISGASVSADIARFHGNNDVIAVVGNQDFTNDRVGLNVGMAGFTVGGSYNDYNSAAANDDGKAWELGVSYETGPYAVSAAYMSGTAETGAATKNKQNEWVLGATYDLGASVVLAANYYSSKASESGAGARANSKISGLVAGIEVGF